MVLHANDEIVQSTANLCISYAKTKHVHIHIYIYIYICTSLRIFHAIAYDH